MQCCCFMLSSVEILILSAIQGISEFLPVSSVAHLVLVSKYYAFTNQNLLIDICLHLGSLIAIIVYFRNDLFHFIKNKSFLIKIIAGTIPIIPVGYILYQTGLIDQLRNLEVIGWMSLIFAILLYVSDKSKVTKKIDTNFTNKSAVFIGLFQVLALIPGVSRSGITITSGRMLGFNRFDSTKISFFLSIPTLIAASFIGIYNIYREGSTELNFLAITATIFSFIFSYITITIFFNYVKKNDGKIGTKTRGIDMNLHNACNLRCKYCFTNSPKGDHVKEYLSPKVIGDLADQADELGYFEFDLQGGELLLRPDLLFETLEAIRPERFYLYLTTNGYYLDKKMAKKLLFLFEEMNKLGTTVLIATHNEDLVKKTKHPIIKLHNGRAKYN